MILIILNKSKKINWWYIVIILILAMLVFGWFFNIGEDLGKALAQ